MKTKVFFLITNVSNCTYWSYVATPENIKGDPIYKRAMQKYGLIYINENGGYFGKDCIKQIHQVYVGEHFPTDRSVPAPTVIEISERLMDGWYDHEGKRQPKYHVQIKGHGGYWSCGRSVDEAVGGLMRSHPEKFGLVFNYLGKNGR